MNEKAIWNFLYDKLQNPYGVAGLMGNLYAESALNPINLQQSYEKKLECTDKSYTNAVDMGLYTNFGDDRAGYGLAQWTKNSRKKALLEFAKESKTSIGDLDMQLNFLWKELDEDFPEVKRVLMNAASIKEASDIVLTKFERPADQSDAAKSKRAGYGEKYYDQWSNGDYGDKEPELLPELITGKRVIITANKVNKRIGDSKEYPSLGFVNEGDAFEHVATSENGWYAIRTPEQVCWVSPEFARVEGASEDKPADGELSLEEKVKILWEEYQQKYEEANG